MMNTATKRRKTRGTTWEKAAMLDLFRAKEICSMMIILLLHVCGRQGKSDLDIARDE